MKFKRTRNERIVPQPAARERGVDSKQEPANQNQLDKLNLLAERIRNIAQTAKPDVEPFPGFITTHETADNQTRVIITLKDIADSQVTTVALQQVGDEYWKLSKCSYYVGTDPVLQQEDVTAYEWPFHEHGACSQTRFRPYRVGHKLQGQPDHNKRSRTLEFGPIGSQTAEGLASSLVELVVERPTTTFHVGQIAVPPLTDFPQSA